MRLKPISIFSITILFSLFIINTGCEQQTKGFALPPGNVEAGKIAFEELRCNDCHSVSDIEWRGNLENLEVPLGGRNTELKTYGKLVTSIINPSHNISKGYYEQKTTPEGESKMMNYNEVMTVQELVDIVTFLQGEYKLVPPTYFYPHYYEK